MARRLSSRDAVHRPSTTGVCIRHKHGKRVEIGIDDSSAAFRSFTKAVCGGQIEGRSNLWKQAVHLKQHTVSDL